MIMKKTATALVVALLAVLVQPVSDARAQFYDPVQLKKVEVVEVEIGDSVRDGCLPRAAVLKTEAELILGRSGVQVGVGFNIHTLDIKAAGFELTSSGKIPTGTCVATLHSSLWRWEVLMDHSNGLALAFREIIVTVGDKDGFQNQLRDEVNEAVTELANEILKARANASSKAQ